MEKKAPAAKVMAQSKYLIQAGTGTPGYDRETTHISSAKTNVIKTGGIFSSSPDILAVPVYLRWLPPELCFFFKPRSNGDGQFY